MFTGLKADFCFVLGVVAWEVLLDGDIDVESLGAVWC